MPYRDSRRSGRPRIIKHLIGEEVVFDSDLYQRLRKNLKNSNSSEYNYYKNNVSWNPSNVNTGLKKANISDNKKIENGKTLADQVVEGKYGLIHNELFRTTPHRPGVLSYIHNIEIPQDDAANFGGLNKKEIWLSEGHLLVLNGGRVNEHFNGSKWKAIDSFSAPLRQVKIPLNPKIPPPFPIQLTDDGPIHFVGRIQIPFCSQFLNDSLCVFPNDVTQGNNFSATNSTKSNKTKKNEVIFDGYRYPAPQSFLVNQMNRTFFNPFPNASFQPFSGSIENTNKSDVDEDNLSLYYPPPYSFEYKNNYSNPVLPGPLVPGIILPPPPNFFGRLDTNTHDTPEDTNNAVLKDYLKNLTVMKHIIPFTNKIENKSIASNVLNRKPIIKDTNNTVEIKTLKTKNSTVLQTIRENTNINYSEKRTTLNIPSTRTQPDKTKKYSSFSMPQNPKKMKSNTVYYEYFDSSNRTQQKNGDYSSTTLSPSLATIAYEMLSLKLHANNSSSNIKRPSSYFSNTYENTPYIVYNENNQFGHSTEFNKEIETIRKTLHYFDTTIPSCKSKYKSNFKSTALSQIQPIYANVNPTDYRRTVNDDFKLRDPNVQFYDATSIFTRKKEHSFNSQMIQKLNKVGSVNIEDQYINSKTENENPHVYYTVITNSKLNHFETPNLYSLKQFNDHVVSNPRIYNNGASGYHQQLYLTSRSPLQTSSVYSKASVSPNYQFDRHYILPQTFKQTTNYSPKNQQHTTVPYLGENIFVNYRHSFPVFNSDSEIYRYNGMKSYIQYQHTIEDKNVFNRS
ncbi:uncharacterized protein LOC131440657 isoform X3 [Malaya genurostris]|uniref:uncharacterized protein LOC131440657 isoform X3 n=1 Tax=Malaya genurostris TaxID=325434 RepID=UPI0026F3FA41|nr:uncharacterized protein LOC131440657 isoform X3 [Malaya genurostris]